MSAVNRSTSGCCFSLGSSMISWFSKKQHLVALSSTEAEYMTVSLASCEAIWLHKMLSGLLGLEIGPMVIHYDNESFIKLSENPVSWQVQVHRDQVPLHHRQGPRRCCEIAVHINKWVGGRYSQQVPSEGEVCVLHGQVGVGGESLPC